MIKKNIVSVYVTKDYVIFTSKFYQSAGQSRTFVLKRLQVGGIQKYGKICEQYGIFLHTTYIYNILAF